MNSKYAFVFPGQGAQFVGMARDFYDIPRYRTFFEQACDRLQYDLMDVMFNGHMDILKETHNTQPAILLHSCMVYDYLSQHMKLQPYCAAGHSLGEFSALVAAGVLERNDAIYLVHKRGKFMIEANQGTPYKMAAILGLDPTCVSAICDDTPGTVVAANFNTPTQTVISGEATAVTAAIKQCTEKGAKRVVELVVGGAFHSPLIHKASEWLHSEMASIRFHSARFPVISNFTALPETRSEDIVENLTKQVISPVQWVRSVQYMIAQKVTTFIECGPGRVATGMIRSIARDTERFNLSTLDDIETFLTEQSQQN